MDRIALVGLGNLGSRHLQGLVRCRRVLAISLYDPSAAAVELAQERWIEAGGQESGHQIVGPHEARYDVAIIATTADHRAAAVSALLDQSDVGAWLLEKPLAQSLSELDTMRSLICKPAWVNLTRRAIPWHQAIAAEMRKVSGTMSVSVVGGAWGLAGNALHFADMMRWWRDSEPTDVDTSGLNKLWHESKRPGYSEIFGSLRLSYGDGSSLTLTSQADGGPHHIAVSTNEGNYSIDEKAGKFTRPDGSILDGRNVFQSELTGMVVQNILEVGAPDLPTFEDVAKIERLLLSAFLAHRADHGGSASRLDVT